MLRINIENTTPANALIDFCLLHRDVARVLLFCIPHYTDNGGKKAHNEQVRAFFHLYKAQMECALDDVHADVLYSTRRCNSSRMEFVKNGMRYQLQQFKRLFIQRDTVVVPLG